MTASTPATRRMELGPTGLRYSFHPAPTPPVDGRPPTLLLHPWFGCREMWQPLADRLEVSSYAVDWYSIAETSGPDAWRRWVSPAGLARAAMCLLDELGLESVDVIGNSVGGIVAQILASERPALVRRLVLIGTGASLGGRPTAFGSLVRRWVDQPEERTSLAGSLVDALVARPLPAIDRDRYVDAVLRANPEFVATVLSSARGTDLRCMLPTIEAPTLVIRGERDTARTRDHVTELVAGLRDARAVELAGLGHSPMIEDPDLVASLVGSHLRG